MCKHNKPKLSKSKQERSSFRYQVHISYPGGERISIFSPQLFIPPSFQTSEVSLRMLADGNQIEHLGSSRNFEMA